MADIIRATALGGLEEGTNHSGHHGLDCGGSPIIVGDTILHNLLRRSPPINVMEMILASLHPCLEGCACGTHDIRHTLFYIAAAMTTTALLIEVLVHVDPGQRQLGTAKRAHCTSLPDIWHNCLLPVLFCQMKMWNTGYKW